jgi:hypothetical protein
VEVLERLDDRAVPARDQSERYDSCSRCPLWPERTIASQTSAAR